MDFLKTFIGSIIFTVAVLLFIDVAGNILTGQTSHEASVKTDSVETAKEEAPTPETKTEEKTEPQPAAVTPEPASSPAVVASSAGDAEAGAKTFRKKCMACHPVSDDGQNRTGPNLFGIIDRAKASMDGFRYSSALEKLGGKWSEAELSTFIAGPRAMVPETKMTFAGLKKQEQRDDVIAYLRTLSR